MEPSKYSMFETLRIPVTKLVQLEVSFRSEKWLDQRQVGLNVFIFKSPAESKLSYLFKALLGVTKISSKNLVFEAIWDGKMYHFFLAIVISR